MGRRPGLTAFLKECMSDALLALMSRKPLAKITVDEIAATAGVNRSTWFRNFGSKEEALSYKLVVLWQRWAEEHGLRERCRFDPENAATFFAFNHAIRDVVTALYAAGARACVYDAFDRVMVSRRDEGLDAYYEASFYAHGLFGLLDAWVGRGFSESPEEVAALFGRMLGR